MQNLIVQTYSFAEICRLLEAARSKRHSDWLMILVAFSHALRASEVLGLTKDSIVGEVLIVERLKQSKKTTQPLFSHENTLLSEREPMIELARKTPPYQKLFPIHRATFWRRMQEYAEIANLPPHLAHPHILKHSFLSQMIKNADIQLTKEWAGHASISSTEKYLHATEKQIAEAARKALNTFDSE